MNHKLLFENNMGARWKSNPGSTFERTPWVRTKELPGFFRKNPLSYFQKNPLSYFKTTPPLTLALEGGGTSKSEGGSFKYLNLLQYSMEQRTPTPPPDREQGPP